MTEHNTSGGLTEGEREALRAVRWESASALDAAVGRILVDRLAAVQAEAKKWERLALGTSMAHDTAVARAESAEAENARLRARLEAVEALAEEWRNDDHRDVRRCGHDLRAALDSPTSHIQQEGPRLECHCVGGPHGGYTCEVCR